MVTFHDMSAEMYRSGKQGMSVQCQAAWSLHEAVCQRVGRNMKRGGGMIEPDGRVRTKGKVPAPLPGALRGFLGDNRQTESDPKFQNKWAPVCVAWQSPPEDQEWVGGHGSKSFFHSPQSLGIKTCGSRCEHTGSDGATVTGSFVLVEHLMWVLEPERLKLLVTGEQFEPFDTNLRKQAFGGIDGGSSQARRISTLKKQVTKQRLSATKSMNEVMQGSEETKGAEGDVLAVDESTKRDQEHENFKSQKQLANYLVSQINLLSECCRGRSYNPITWLEKSFSYDMLLNLATNDLLPYTFRAAVVHFVRLFTPT